MSQSNLSHFYKKQQKKDAELLSKIISRHSKKEKSSLPASSATPQIISSAAGPSVEPEILLTSSVTARSVSKTMSREGSPLGKRKRDQLSEPSSKRSKGKERIKNVEVIVLSSGNVRKISKYFKSKN